jgi:hypothetical protein
MSSPKRLLVGLCAAPLLASCVFLLDYDELKSKGDRTPQNRSGAGGAPDGVSGGAGIGGQGGAGCGDCDDHDPCTVDTCDETGDAPACLHEATVGLKLDDFEQVLQAEQHMRVSLVAGSDVFYLAALEANEDAPSVHLYRLAKDGTELEPLGEDLFTGVAAGTPVSNVGLAVDPTLGLAVHGYVAIKPEVGDLPPRVFHVINRGDTTTTELVGMSYRADNPWVFPQALAIGNKVYGAWIQEDGLIGVHETGAALPPPPFGDATLPATTLALLSTENDEPAVLFTSETEEGPLGAFVETRAMNRVQISECQSAPGNYLSSSVISTQLPGLFLGNITKAGDDYLTTGGTTLICGANDTCSAVTDTCEPGDDANGVRNLAGATVRFQDDPPGVIYSVLVLPQLTLKADSDTDFEAKLSLLLGRADFSEEGAGASATIGGDRNGLTEIARQDTDEAAGFTGPDWPAVGILPSEHVALAWIQPNADRTGTELHVQRYKMCLPAPD